MVCGSPQLRQSCLGSMCLMAILATMVVTHNALADAESVNPRLQYVSNLRGGSSSDGNLPSGGGDPDLKDEELDEYIDFLLAYADDKATEEDNPLFRDAAPLLEDKEDATALEQKILDSSDAEINPLVDDVNDETQLDAMVETLVASVEDTDIEGEPSMIIQDEAVEDFVEPSTPTDEVDSAVEVDVLVDDTSTTNIEDGTPQTPVTESVDGSGEEVVESDTFFLGSSAVENMPLPVNVEGDATEVVSEATTPTSTEPTEPRVSLFTSFMQKMGLSKKESPLDDSADVEQDETAVIAPDASVAAEEPVIAISDSDCQSPVATEVEDSGASEPEAEKERMQIIAPITAAVTNLGETVGDQMSKTKQIVGDQMSKTKQAVSDSVAKTTQAVSDSVTKTKQVASDSVTKTKEYYQGAWGSVKDVWSKKRWYGKATETPARDYNKIYEKYFASNDEPSEADDVASEKGSNRLSSAFLRPWGTVTKYFTPTEDSERSPVDYYSIGIKGYVAEDSTSETASQEVDSENLGESEAVLEVDADETPECIEVITIDDQEAAEDHEVVIEVDPVEAPEDDSVVLEQDVEETQEAAEDHEVVVEVDPVEEAEDDSIVIEEDMEESLDAVAGDEVLDIDAEEAPEDDSIVLEEDVEETPEAAEDDVSVLEEDLEETLDAPEVDQVVLEVDLEEEAEDDSIVLEENVEETPEAAEDDVSVLEVDAEEAAEDDSIVLEEDVEETLDAPMVDEVVLEVDAEEEAEDDSIVIEDVGETLEAAEDDEVLDIAAEEAPEDDSIVIEDVGETLEAAEDDEVLDIAAEEAPEDDSIVLEEDPEETLDAPEVDEVVFEVDLEEEAEDDSIVLEEDVEETLEAAEDDVSVLEVDAEETPEYSEDVTVGLDAPEDPEVVLEEETEQPSDSTEDTPADGPRKANIFARLWGITKVHKTVDPVEGDSEVTETSTEETIEEADDSIDDQETVTEEGSRKSNIINRLWGTSKEPNENYYLGLQGVKKSDVSSDSDTVDTSIDVDISVSIGIVDEEDESLDCLEISESSGVEDMDDDIDVDQLEDTIEIIEPEIVDTEDTQADRDVLQLHIPERRDEEEPSSLSETSTIEVADNISIPEDSNDSDEIYTLQLHQEDPVSEQTFTEEPEVGSLEEEMNEKEDSTEFIVADADAYVVSEEEEDFIEQIDEDVADSFVTETVEVVVSEEVEEVIEQFDEEEDEEGLLDEDYVEDVVSEEIQVPVEQEELEEDVEEDVSIQINEEEIELVESENEEQIYADELEEDECLVSVGSSPYSLEVEMQNSNFVSRFLVNQGLEQLIMVAIVITEWFREYILAPLLESIEWIKEGKAQDLVQTVINTRGGALAPTLSESEDVAQTDEEYEDILTEEALTQDQPADVSDTEKTDDPEAGSLQDSQEENSEQDDPAEGEKSTTETVSAEKPLPASPQVPPNFIFRRLLYYGHVGNILIMEMILASEWLNLYVPQIRSVTNYILYDVLKRKRRSGRRPGEPENFMNSGFINIGEGSRLPSKSKKQRKKEDQKALDQLKAVGDVNQAKYSFISMSFMERHGLGKYTVASSETEVDPVSSKKRFASRKNDGPEEDEAESDSGWILDALGVGGEEEDAGSKSSLPFDTSVGVSMGSDGPQVSVGVEFNIGGKKKSKASSSQKLRSAIVGNTIKPKRKKSPKPHVSDNESGIMGRLRAQGANSLVGRNILGAYPGDLPPPDEAADSRGVANMARRYGYGDWSDDEDEDEPEEYSFGGDEDDDEDEDDDQFRPKKRKRKIKKRRSSSSSTQNQQSEPVSLSSSSTKRRRSIASTSLSSAISGSTPSSGSRRRRKTRTSRLPSPAMETLGGSPAGSRSTSSSKRTSAATPTKTTSPSSDTNIRDILKDSVKKNRKTRAPGPAMSILNEAKKATESDDQ